jgi:hypothetical protein
LCVPEVSSCVVTQLTQLKSDDFTHEEIVLISSESSLAIIMEIVVRNLVNDA